MAHDYLCVPDWRRTGKGMVAGGAISPLLGGLYLTPLARAMEGLCKKDGIRYQRFMDDDVIFAKTRNKLKEKQGQCKFSNHATDQGCENLH